MGIKGEEFDATLFSRKLPPCLQCFPASENKLIPGRFDPGLFSKIYLMYDVFIYVILLELYFENARTSKP